MHALSILLDEPPPSPRQVATSYWAVGRGVAKVFDDFDDARQYSYTAASKKKAVVVQETYSCALLFHHFSLNCAIL